MTHWKLSPELARQLVESGRKNSGKSIQTRPRPLPQQNDEILVALFQLRTSFTRNESNEYEATGRMIDSSGAFLSGDTTIYAPSATNRPDNSARSKVHAAFLNGRWELLDVKDSGYRIINAGTGITVTLGGVSTNGQPYECTISNAGVTSLRVDGSSTLKTGEITLDARYFEFGGDMYPQRLTVKKNVLRGEFLVGASQTGDTVTLTFGIADIE